MVTILRFPLTPSLPEIPLATLKEALSSREWHTYSVGIRAKDETRKPLLLKAVRARLANTPLFNGKMLAFEFPDAEIILDEVENTLVLQIQPLIITGRYTKLQRGIAQTRHFCFECKGTGKKNNTICSVCHGEKIRTKESVQELITPFFQKHFSCGEVLFHGAGREDVDVRMLGKGRPFALTLENPIKRNVEVLKIQEEINSALQKKAQVSDLQIGFPSDVTRITQRYHTKRYRALVEAKEKISLENLKKYVNEKVDVLQTTPLRVEKRRAMKERPHWIILEKIQKIDETLFEIQLHASAGCYIKEFISGDEGRSKPSFSEWLNMLCVCKELDVLEIVEEESGGFSV